MKKYLALLVALLLLVVGCPMGPVDTDTPDAGHRVGSFTPTFASHTVATQAMADADQTPTASILTNGVVKLTGALTAERQLILPALPDAAARLLVIDNECTGAFGVKVWNGSGPYVTVPNGQVRTVLDDSRGVTAVSHGLAGSGQASFVYGVGATATTSYASALGAYCTASGAGSFAAGETATASAANASALGFSCTASGIFSSALGSYCVASAQGATALGLKAGATRAGEFAHNSGFDNLTGVHWIDLAKDINAGTATLQDATSVSFSLDTTTLYTMKVAITAIDSTGAKRATSVRYLEVSTATGSAVIDNETETYGPTSHLLSTFGWSVTTSAPAGLELRFSFNASGDSIRAAAHVEWTAVNTAAIPGVSWTPASLPGLTMWEDPTVTVAVGGKVTNWTDRSGLGHALTDGSTGNGPATGTSINAHATLDYNGTTSFLGGVANSITAATLFSATQWTIAGVFRYTGANGEQVPITQNAPILADQNSSFGEAIGVNVSTAFLTAEQDDAVTKSTAVAVTANTNHYFIAKYDGTKIYISMDGGAFTAGTLAGSISTLTHTMYTGIGTWAAAKNFQGSLGDVITCNVVISGPNATSLNTYLAAKYGI